MKINLVNPRFNLAFINCDESISHSNSKAMQLYSNCSLNELQTIAIIDSDRIKNTVSAKYLPSDMWLNKAVYEANKYSILYEKLDIGYSTDKITDISADYFSEIFGISSYYKGSSNLIVVTCSTTDIKVVEQIKEITYNSPFGTFIHIHVEQGNIEEGGAVYTAVSQKGKVIQPYSSDFDFLDIGPLETSQMLSQCNTAGTIVTLTIANILKFNDVAPNKISFNINSMEIGQDIRTSTPMKPIKLLKPRKTKKNKKGKKGKNRTYKKDFKIHVIYIGTGATGGTSLPDALEQMNLTPENIGTIALVDGDVIETKNLQNQRCLPNEVGKFKVEALARRYKSIHPSLNIRPYNKYLYDLNEDILKEILGLNSLKDETILCIGAVDNNETRKLLDNTFRYTNKCRNFLYLDSGNGADIREGQTVMGYKQYGKVILKPVATCGIDNGVIRSNTGDIKKIGSCTQALASRPQHYTTNILAARSLINHIDKVIQYGEIHAHFSKFYLEPITIISGAPIN